mmetsp:Transcript_35572/g.83306  ORF Transcript_35572/g.83306 Transcript_35572/m.83306 type:complete len:241 (+) Transcript_35572:523-1245(+)
MALQCVPDAPKGSMTPEGTERANLFQGVVNSPCLTLTAIEKHGRPAPSLSTMNEWGMCWLTMSTIASSNPRLSCQHFFAIFMMVPSSSPFHIDCVADRFDAHSRSPRFSLWVTIRKGCSALQLLLAAEKNLVHSRKLSCSLSASPVMSHVSRRLSPSSETCATVSSFRTYSARRQVAGWCCWRGSFSSNDLCAAPLGLCCSMAIRSRRTDSFVPVEAGVHFRRSVTKAAESSKWANSDKS